MIRRIFVVGLYTGSAHLASIVAISYLLRNLGERTLGFIGLVDSTVLIVAGIVSFGIQLSVNRNVALQKNWRSNYHLGQSARPVRRKAWWARRVRLRHFDFFCTGNIAYSGHSNLTAASVLRYARAPQPGRGY